MYYRIEFDGSILKSIKPISNPSEPFDHITTNNAPGWLNRELAAFQSLCSVFGDSCFKKAALEHKKYCINRRFKLGKQLVSHDDFYLNGFYELCLYLTSRTDTNVELRELSGNAIRFSTTNSDIELIAKSDPDFAKCVWRQLFSRDHCDSAFSEICFWIQSHKAKVPIYRVTAGNGLSPDFAVEVSGQLMFAEVKSLALKPDEGEQQNNEFQTLRAIADYVYHTKQCLAVAITSPNGIATGTSGEIVDEIRSAVLGIKEFNKPLVVAGANEREYLIEKFTSDMTDGAIPGYPVAIQVPLDKYGFNKSNSFFSGFWCADFKDKRLHFAYNVALRRPFFRWSAKALQNALSKAYRQLCNRGIGLIFVELPIVGLMRNEYQWVCDQADAIAKQWVRERPRRRLVGVILEICSARHSTEPKESTGFVLIQRTPQVIGNRHWPETHKLQWDLHKLYSPQSGEMIIIDK
ncbi:MAG: hypothetical protein K1X53_02515 [Candidatus Sumerlaeaceae bacterium]|nr:hypothetical protein [Candidatus Sumerlaeaceae bacterium]